MGLLRAHPTTLPGNRSPRVADRGSERTLHANARTLVTEVELALLSGRNLSDLEAEMIAASERGQRRCDR